MVAPHVAVVRGIEGQGVRVLSEVLERRHELADQPVDVYQRPQLALAQLPSEPHRVRHRASERRLVREVRLGHRWVRLPRWHLGSLISLRQRVGKMRRVGMHEHHPGTIVVFLCRLHELEGSSLNVVGRIAGDLLSLAVDVPHPVEVAERLASFEDGPVVEEGRVPVEVPVVQVLAVDGASVALLG